MPVIGSAVGHQCRIGSGFVVYPGRMIGSNTTLVYAEPATALARNINVAYHAEPLPVLDDEPEQTVYVWPHLRGAQPGEPGDAEPGAAYARLEMSLRGPGSVLHRRTSR